MPDESLFEDRDPAVVSSRYTGLRAQLLEGTQQLVGIFVTIPRIEVVEIAAHSGFDLVVIDCEHGPFGIEALQPLIAAGHGCGLAVVVRVPENGAHVIGAALDAGADGVLVPHVNSGEAAAHAGRASRFPPLGERSVHNWIRGAGYGADTDYVTTADAGVALLVMLEGADALGNLPDLLANPHVDSIFVGPMDLAASLGLVDQPGHRRVHQIAAQVLEAAAASGKAGAIFAPTPQAARDWLAAGARLVVLSVDTELIRRGFRSALADLRAQPPTDNRRGPKQVQSLCAEDQS